MSDFVDVSDLSDDTRAALRRHIISLADTKRFMGIRYSDWLLGAPTLETCIAASSMAQDEWGHARLLYAMLKDLGEDPTAVEHDRADDEFANVSALDEPLPDWAAVIAAMVLVDGAITAALESFAEGRFESATSRGPKMILEEEFHRSLGDAWYRRLADSTSEEARDLLAAATRSMLSVTLAWLGAADSEARALVEAGIIGDPKAAVDSYRERVGPLVALAGIELDEVQPAQEWDSRRGRAPGQPDADSCERVRGDRNRALFVE